MIFRVTFLNCYNLFPLGTQVERNNLSDTDEELTSKIESLVRTILSTSPGSLPDIVALCEVGTEPLGRRIARLLNARNAGGDDYSVLWSGLPQAGLAQTGLILLYNTRLFEQVEGTLRQSPAAITERFKWMAVQFRLRAEAKAAFWLVVNHWSSKYADRTAGTPASPFVSPLSEVRQTESAEEIGQLYLEKEHHSTRTMILIGDFNCELGDKPFRSKPSFSFVGARERRVVTRRGNSKAYFYNPMWRRIGEPHDNSVAAEADYQRPLTGTWVGAENKADAAPLFDQILVSPGLLSGQHLRFIESSLTIAPPETGMTDHCALSAQFECLL